MSLNERCYIGFLSVVVAACLSVMLATAPAQDPEVIRHDEDWVEVRNSAGARWLIYEPAIQAVSEPSPEDAKVLGHKAVVYLAGQKIFVKDFDIDEIAAKLKAKTP